METKRDRILKALDQIGGVILGKEEQIREIMLALLANGHVLLEDIPGVGKTTLALAFSRALDLEFRRIQFTPDVLPSDLTGFSIYRREEEKFVYQRGSVFCNLLLADELNRTSPKTQSALLEVMEERKVTVEGVTREVPLPFFVIATQNPAGGAGTQPVSEAQVDRFMISTSIGYPDLESELDMAKGIGYEDRLDRITPVLESGTLLEIQEEICDVYISDPVYRYLVDLVRTTRDHPRLVRGGSPRATIALVRLARASAWMAGRDYVIPEDVAGQFPYVIRHRIILSSGAKMEQVKKDDIAAEILEKVHRPSLGEKLK